MMSRANYFLGICLCVLASAACSRTSGVEGNFVREQEQSPLNAFSQYVIMSNERLGSDVGIADARAVLAGNMLRAQITVRSYIHDTLSLQYKFSWLNKQGMEIDAGSQSWQPFTLYGMETKAFQGVCPNPSANSYRVLIREQENY